MYGFDLQGNAPLTAARSDQVYRQNITASDGTLLGSVELSDGPTYGMDIVKNVAFGWLIASLVGMLIAVLAGWWIQPADQWPDPGAHRQHPAHGCR